jgi:transposase
VLDMTRLRNRLHALLLLCDPEYSQVIRSLRSRRGIQAARTYTAPGMGQLERVRERAVRQVAEQITLLMDQERELRTNIEASVRQHFVPLLSIEGVQPVVAAGLIAELGMPRPGFAYLRSQSWPVSRQLRPPAQVRCVIVLADAATAV